MTLILTELSSLGIAMAADSAMTIDVRKPDGTIGDKVYYGAQKLFIVPKLRAGIAYWGCWVYLPQPDSDWNSDKESQDLMELWLPQFLQSNKDQYNSIAELAQLLETELRRRVPKINVEDYPLGDGGIHLAGYESLNGQRLPTFWHIHNGKSQALPMKSLDPAIVNANNDIPPTEEYFKIIQLFEALGRPLTIRNGDIDAYVALYDLLFTEKSEFPKIIKTIGYTFPHVTTLEDKAKFLKFQIQTVEGIYKFSKEGRGIGGPITILTISPSEIISYLRE